MCFQEAYSKISRIYLMWGKGIPYNKIEQLAFELQAIESKVQHLAFELQAIGYR